MKKYSFVLLLGAIACLFVGCAGGSSTHPDLIGEDPEGGKICFFQFRDTSYLNKIIVWKAIDVYAGSKYVKNLSSKYDIPLYPKHHEGQPIFGERASGTNYDFGYLNGDFYALEELVNSPKFIALKGDYYICYPYTALEFNGHYIDAEWKDFYTTDFEKAEICTLFPYKKRYNISELILANLTQKSTEHFERENPEMITIDDVVETLNRLIETNSIDKYCYEIYN